MEKELVLCDTNIFINWYSGNAETVKIIESIGYNNVLISSVSVMELYQGMDNKTELQQLKVKIKKHPTIHFTEEVSELSTKLIEEYKLSHHLQIPDAIIAATAIIFNLALFTYNLKDFKYIPNLRLHKIITPK